MWLCPLLKSLTFSNLSVITSYIDPQYQCHKSKYLNHYKDHVFSYDNGVCENHPVLLIPNNSRIIINMMSLITINMSLLLLPPVNMGRNNHHLGLLKMNKQVRKFLLNYGLKKHQCIHWILHNVSSTCWKCLWEWSRICMYLELSFEEEDDLEHAANEVELTSPKSLCLLPMILLQWVSLHLNHHRSCLTLRWWNCSSWQDD